MITAAPFAGTTAGYLTGVGTPIIALLVAGMWRAWANRLREQDRTIAKIVEASTESNKALAILLSDHAHVAAAVLGHTAQITELTTSTAVLASQVNEHHRWVERQQAAGVRTAL